MIAWKRKPAPGANAIAVMMVGVTIWCFTYGLQMLFKDTFWKPLIDGLSYAGILIVPAAWLVFTLQFTGMGSRLSRRRLGWLLIEPILVVIALVTNPIHDQFYTVKTLVWIDHYAYLTLGHGPLFWVNALYSYLLLAGGSIILVRWMARTPGLYRVQTVALLVGLAAPWAGNIIYIFGLFPIPGLDTTPLAFVLTGLAVILGVYRFHLLDLTPIARDALIEVMDDSVIVLDNTNRIVDINLAACRLLGCDVRQAIGTHAAQSFAQWPSLTGCCTDKNEVHQSVTFEINGVAKTYDLRITPVLNQGSVQIGRLFLLRDITSTQEMQESLRTSELRYRLLVETSPDAIVLTDLRGHLFLYNRAASQLLAVPEDERLTGVSIYTFVAPEDRQLVVHSARKARMSGKSQQFEMTCQARCGRLFPAEVHLITMRDREDQPTSFIGILRDVTARKQNEREILRAVEAEREQREVADALREIGAVLNSSLELDTILDQMLEQMGRVVPFDTGNITLVQGEHAVITRSRGYENFGIAIPMAIQEFVFDLRKTENFRWMLEHKTPLVITDTGEYPGWVQLEATRYIRSWIGAPIIAQGEVIAFFSLDKCEPNFYNSQHGRILEAFAGQAALAMRNAAYYNETNELLTREHHLNEMLQKIGSTLEFSKVLEGILQLGSNLVGADSGIIGLLDDSRTNLEFSYIYGIALKDMDTRLPYGEGLTWQVIQSGKPLLVNDYSAHPKAREIVKRYGVCAVLIVPIHIGSELMGVLGFYITTKERVFHPQDLPLAETISSYAGVAIQNARLYADAHRRAEEAETLRQASNAITSALNLDLVLDEIMTNLAKVVPFDSCAVFLLEEDQLRIVAARGFPDLDKVLGASFISNNPLTQEGFRTGKVVILADAQTDPRFQGWGDSGHVHGWMGIPLFARGMRTGFLTIDSREPNAYSQMDGELAQAFGNQAAIAIVNARLFEKVQHLAFTDPLTDLYNRRHFFDLARNEFYRARRYGKPLSLLMMDIDDLKLINDSYGHQIGDQVVQFIADQCRSQLRQADIASRYAGDEFVILLPETTKEGAITLAQRIKTGTCTGFQIIDDQKIPLSISIGVVALDPACFSLELLINRADQALFGSKQMGKNRICFWEEDAFYVVPDCLE